MKVAAFAITLMLGGAAIAQTSTTHTGHTGTNTDVSVQTGTTGTNSNASVQTGTTGVEADVDVNAQTTTTQPSTSWSTSTQSNTSTTWNSGQTTMASNMAGQTVAPSNANPERDARGIRVISDPAMAPAGYNGSAGTGMGGPVSDTGASMGAEASHPPCSATVTDNCVQTYERGRSPR